MRYDEKPLGYQSKLRCSKITIIIFLISIFCISAKVYAGKNYSFVVHNNTGATLTMSLKGRDRQEYFWKISPNSKKSFFNLYVSTKWVFFKASCVSGKPMFSLNLSTRRREYYLFAKNFGKSVMFDIPNCGKRKAKTISVQARCNAIVGRWRWFNGINVDFFSNGLWKAVNQEGAGRWFCEKSKFHGGVTGSVVVIPDRGKWQDTVRVSTDGKSLSGKNQQGVRVSATRISSGSGRNP